MTVYDTLADFYQSAMKELMELSYGPSTEEKFKDFCAKFSKKKKQLRAEEKAHRQKCLKGMIALAVIAPIVNSASKHLYAANANAYGYVNAADANAKKAVANYNLQVKTESSNEGMSLEETEAALKMISSEMGYYAKQLMNITNAAYKEAESACDEFLKEYERENSIAK